jgi:integrase
MGTTKMPTPIRPKKANGKEQNVYWIRKKVPGRYRPLVGKGEVWRSLRTTDLRTANLRIAMVSAELEQEWSRLALEAKRGPKDSSGGTRLTHQDIHALRANAHVQIRDAHIADPGTGGFATMRWAALLGQPATTDDEEYLDQDAREFLARQGETPTEAEVEKFKPLFLAARQDAYRDLIRASKGDYSENPVLGTLPKRTKPKVDIMEAFELYCSQPRIKGGLDGPTAKRWRPVIERFIEWIKHRDLARVTPQDAVRWRDYMLSQGKAPKAVRDVWLAAPRSVATHMLNALRLEINPFAGIKVEGVKAWKEDDERGFDPEQALTILSATVASPSHLISREMKAARRWVPWICAYTGARVNEVTSLLPSDVQQILGHWCFVLRPEITKGKRLRRVPVHKHLIEQPFLQYVEERRKIGKPLFYEPARARGGKSANPQWHKVAGRLGEWVRESLKVTDVQPNHGWRHLWREIVRGTRMKPELCDYMCGHESKSGTGARYGKRKVPVLAKEMALFPRFRVPALSKLPVPHKRTRRARAKIGVEFAAKALGKRSAPRPPRGQISESP